MRGYYQEMWSLFIKKFRNRTPKTALFINSQAQQFSNLREKKKISLDSTAKPTTYGKRFQIEHYRKCLASVQFDLWLLAEIYFSYIFSRNFPSLLCLRRAWQRPLIAVARAYTHVCKYVIRSHMTYLQSPSDRRHSWSECFHMRRTFICGGLTVDFPKGIFHF